MLSCFEFIYTVFVFCICNHYHYCYIVCYNFFIFYFVVYCRSICIKFGVGNATAFRSVRRVTYALYCIAPRFIQWPAEVADNVIDQFARDLWLPWCNRRHRWDTYQDSSSTNRFSFIHKPKRFPVYQSSGRL